MSTLYTLNADAFDVEAVRGHFDFPRNTEAEVDRAVDALAGIVAPRRGPFSRPRAVAGSNRALEPTVFKPAFPGSLS